MQPESKIDELRTRISFHVLLENTRILAKGIEGLYQQYVEQNSSKKEMKWEMNSLLNFVRRIYRESISESEKEYFAQNPHTDFFRFRLERPSIEKAEGTDGVRVAAMLLMHHELTQLEKNQDEGSLLSSYENLCNCLRDITGFNMCYMVHRHLDDTHILAASAVHRKNLHTMLYAKTMAEMLDDFQDVRAQPDAERGNQFPLEQLTGDIFLLKRGRRSVSGNKNAFPDDVSEENQFLLLPLDFSGQMSHHDGEMFLVFHREQEITQNLVLPGLLARIRDALFLRGRLANMLERDFFHLLNAHREYRRITRKSDKNGPIRILHLSDLHVTRDNCEEIVKCIRGLKLDADREGKCRKPFDFIAITGDVAQGRCSAGDLETNYEYAAEVIRELAFKFWSRPTTEQREEDRVLDQDWKKRILIVPGNHDYASMNELETQHDETHRASAGGRPAAKEGSSMAKFTYYINFLRRLLDVDIGDLVDNGLNEFRSYDDLGVNFLSFNTSIMANPIRNNKVHLDEKFVESIASKLKRIDQKNAVVCLCHHGPQYEIDYLSDQYYEAYICERFTKRFNEYAKSLVDGLAVSEEVDMEKLKTELDAMWDQLEKNEGDLLNNESVQAWLLESDSQRIPENISGQIIKKRKKARLYADYQLLANRDATAPPCSIDERYQNILHAIRRAMILSVNDMKAYKETFAKLPAEKIVVTLSGHTHKSERRDDNCQYVADRFFSKRVQRRSEMKDKQSKNDALEIRLHLNFGICEIFLQDRMTKRPKVNYQFKTASFRKKPDKANEENTFIEQVDIQTVKTKC